ALGVWQRIEDAAQPIAAMEITDSRLEDAVRPTFLSFDSEAADGEPAALMVENRAVLVALRAAAREAGVRLLPAAVADFSAGEDFAEVRLSDGARLRARLIVAADGARSKLRTLAGIKTVNWSYGQSGI